VLLDVETSAFGSLAAHGAKPATIVVEVAAGS